MINQGITGIHSIGTGLRELGSMFIPGLPDSTNRRPGGVETGPGIGSEGVAGGIAGSGGIGGGMGPGGTGGGWGPGGIGGGMGPGGIEGGMGPGGIGGGMGPGSMGRGMIPGRGVGLALPMKAEEALAESMANAN